MAAAPARSELPELLAPAGSFDALRAAVENGADAVYLGGKQFHARGRAVNFGDEELRRATDYAHAKGVNVYVTVNTLLANDEFDELGRYLEEVYAMGADAIIVQDLGVMEFAHRFFPDLPIHASTQACIHTSRAVNLMERFGVQRIILPRELTLPEIKAMRQRTRVPLEVFVHGALCYSYSGQCLSSSLIGGRSGNRGQCASTCRLPYDLLEHPGAVALGAMPEGRDLSDWPWREMPLAGHYLESSRDLCTVEFVPKLVEAGVRSFKIEGRMKRPEYVAIATRVYRTALDRHAKGTFHITPEERKQLEQVFNRRFTPGYFLDNPGNAFVSDDRSENRGLLAGEVSGFRGQDMIVRLKEPLAVGDGIEVWNNAGGFGQRVRALFVRDLSVRKAEPGELVRLPKQGWASVGDPVYKTADLRILQEAAASYERAQRRVPVHVVATLDASGLTVEVRDEAGVSGRGTVPVQPARSQPLTAKAIESQLAKLGGTPLRAKGVEVSAVPGFFAPLAEVNRARRTAAERFLDARAAARRRPRRERAPEPFGGFLALPSRQPAARLPVAVHAPNPRALEAALAGGADEIYFPPLEWGGDKDAWNLDWCAMAIARCRDAGKECFLHLPYITRDADLAYAEETLPALRDLGPAGVLAGNLGMLALARDLGFRVRGDYFLNVFNSYTVRVLASMGVESLCLSPELTLGQMAGVARHSPLPVEAVAHGQLHLMISEHCIIGAAEGCYTKGKHVPCRRSTYAIRDQKGYVFPLLTDGKCRMHMMNSRELAMIDRLPEVREAGIARLRIDAQSLHPANLEAVVRAYKEATQALVSATPYDGAALLARVEAARSLPLTTGHFFRPVL